LDWKLWKIKENKTQIFKNIEEIKTQLSIIPRDLRELSFDFWSENISLDFKSLQILQQQWWKFYDRHLQNLNEKPIKLERREMMKDRCDMIDMIKYNNMSEEDFQEVYSSLQS
jgi:hypothetical protein